MTTFLEPQMIGEQSRLQREGGTLANKRHYADPAYFEKLLLCLEKKPARPVPIRSRT